MSRTIRYNNFNLIRLIAAFQVLLVHSLNHFEIDGAWVALLKATPGVPTFFVISGFLIGASYFRTHERGARSFFINRALRIYPGLVICVLFATLVVFATGYFSTQEVSVGQVIFWVLGQSSFLQFYNPEFMRDFGVGVLNGALWTITVELQFYLFTPILFIFLVRWKLVFCSLLLMSVAVNLWVHHGAAPEVLSTKLLRVSFLPWIYMFMFGFVLAWRVDWLEMIQRVGWLPLLSGYTVAMVFVGSYSENAQNSINPLAFLFLGCIIMKLAYFKINLIAGFQQFIDETDISYGLYLYHMPIINFLLYVGVGAMISVPIVAVGSVCAALLSWYFIERPALNYKR